jgi:tetratricopeptide (TPR) repeat protein
LFELANAHRRCGQLKVALQNLTESEDIISRLDQTPNVVANHGAIFATIGLYAVQLGELDFAQTSFLDAIDCYQRVNAVVGPQNRQWHNLLCVYRDLAGLQMASEHYTDAEKTCIEAKLLISTLELGEPEAVAEIVTTIDSMLTKCLEARSVLA